MARQGRGAAALTTAAIGSFVAGTLATVALTFFSPPLAALALRFGPAEYFALSILAFTAVTALLGGSLARGLFSLFLGLALGLIGIDQLTGDARFSFGMPQLLDGIDVLVLVIGLFAVGETLLPGVAPRARAGGSRRAADVHRHEPRGMAALVASVAARHRHRLSARRAAGRRLGHPHLSLLRGGEAAEPATRGVRARRDRGRGRARGRQQRRGGRRAGAAAHAGPAVVGHGRGAAGGVPAVRPAAGTAAVLVAARPGVDAHRQPLHRQRHAAGAEPAARAACGRA